MVCLALSVLATNVQNLVIFPSVPAKLEHLVTPFRVIRNMCPGDMKTREEFLDLYHTSCVTLDNKFNFNETSISSAVMKGRSTFLNKVSPKKNEIMNSNYLA